jgi:NADPH-dependent curcumin reductase CurA
MVTHDILTTKAAGKNRQWLLDARPVGKLTGKEFRWHEASIPQPSDGQVLVRNLWLSVDPAQRMYVRIAFVKNRAHPAEIPAYSVSFRLARL